MKVETIGSAFLGVFNLMMALRFMRGYDDLWVLKVGSKFTKSML